MSITVNCSIDLTEEELMHVLLSRAKLKAAPWTFADFLVVPDKAPSDVATVVEPTFVPPTGYANTPEPEVIPVEPPPLPPKQQRNRAKTNGAEAPINSTPLAPSPPPPPETLDEPAMRSLLSKVGAVHPLKVKAITNILENCGGARRLSECDPSTWPAIAEAALAALKEHSA